MRARSPIFKSLQPSHRALRLTAFSMAALMTLNGCASFPRPLTVPQEASLNAPETRTVDEAGSDAYVDIDAGFVGDDLFIVKPIADSQPLPAMQLSGMTVTESGVYDALRLILKDTGITLNIEGGNRGSERFGSVSAFDVKGSLTDVLDNLSESIGFFYSFRRNTLFIKQEQQFVVELPPALSEDNAAGLTNTLQFLGARDPYIDRLNRSLVFSTNRPSLAKIESYLQRIRDTRSLIIYDVNIFQVDLRDNSDTGIQWNKLGWAGTPGVAAGGGASLPTAPATAPAAGGAVSTAAGAVAGSAATAVATGLGLGLVLSSSRFSIEMLINFLQSQGNVKAISRPRLAVISGTRGSLRVGQSTTYVSKVGTNFSTSVNQVTTETRDLKTGLDLALFGDFSDNTIYTRIGLAISEIVSLNKFTALGTDLTLPTTADREINTVIRARPGDMILLGGITINRDSNEIRRGLSQNGTANTVSRSELVLALKAKVVSFRGKGATAMRDGAVTPALTRAIPPVLVLANPPAPVPAPPPRAAPAPVVTPAPVAAPPPRATRAPVAAPAPAAAPPAPQPLAPVPFIAPAPLTVPAPGPQLTPQSTPLPVVVPDPFIAPVPLPAPGLQQLPPDNTSGTQPQVLPSTPPSPAVRETQVSLAETEPDRAPEPLPVKMVTMRSPVVIRTAGDAPVAVAQVDRLVLKLDIRLDSLRDNMTTLAMANSR